MEALTPSLAAVVRRLPNLTQRELVRLIEIAGEMVTSAPAEVEAVIMEARARDEALSAMHAVAAALRLPEGKAPTATQMRNHARAAAPGWTTARVTTIFGRWRSATEAYEGRPEPLSARQRAHLRAARLGVFRQRDDYLAGVRAWLHTQPPSLTADDYDAWRREHNAALPDGEHPVVSYSMLRKALPWSWETTKLVASGALAAEDAPTRSASTTADRHGPHDLIGIKTICELLGLNRTAARNLTYSRTFPAPAYTQPRPPRIRLWRRSTVIAFGNGAEVEECEPNDLQDFYLDAHAVAEALGLARITVTTRSSPRVPDPAVLVAGLQLWMRRDIDAARRAA